MPGMPPLAARVLQKVRRDGLAATARLALKRLLRPVRAGPSPLGLSPPPAGLRAHIDRFSHAHGVVHIEGWIEAPAQISRLGLQLGDGVLHDIRLAPRAGGGVSIRQRLQTDATVGEVALAELWVWLAGGGRHALTDLAAPAEDPAHVIAGRFLQQLRAQPQGRLLEIGARARSGIARRDFAPPGWRYEGFDIMAGPNVDTVGDAHELSRHYPPASFDACMSLSVFEHLLMPWKAAVELNRVLKPGGLVLVSSHQAWPLHDEPWDFWRFSDNGWRALFNPATGFEVVAVAMGEPAMIVPRRLHPAVAFTENFAGALASIVLARKIGETQLDWPVALHDVIETSYPPGEIG